MSDRKIMAIDLNPLHWLGDAASAAVGDVWKAAMTGLWSAALWILKLAFKIIDEFTTPDLSASGPLGRVLPTTLWLGGALAVIMMFVQLTLALLRRDGKSLGQVVLGVAQFGAVWVGFLAVTSGLVAAAAGLSRGILAQMLNANSMSEVDLSGSFPDKIGDVTLATVLGILGLLIVIPSAFFYLLIMFVREAALIILVATAPISAAGLVSEVGKTWFWKTLRWFFSCLLISPVAALLLGIGVQLSNGVIDPPPSADEVFKMCQAHPQKCDPFKGAPGLSAAANASATAHAGMAVVGCIIIAIGACCPLILFRLLAFVEPGTASGAALRQSWSDAGGMSGLLGGSGGKSQGSGAATQSGNDGRSGGESGAESQTQSRLAQALGAFGAGVGAVTSIANRAADIGSDILGQAGVGSPGYSMTPTDERSSRRNNSGGRSEGEDSTGDTAGGGNGTGGNGTGGNGTGGNGTGGNPPEPPTPPMPGGPGGSGGGSGGGGGLPKSGGPAGGGVGGAGAAGGGAEAAAVVAV